VLKKQIETKGLECLSPEIDLIPFPLMAEGVVCTFVVKPLIYAFPPAISNSIIPTIKR